jgi:hypothetical protein
MTPLLALGAIVFAHRMLHSDGCAAVGWLVAALVAAFSINWSV